VGSFWVGGFTTYIGKFDLALERVAALEDISCTEGLTLRAARLARLVQERGEGNRQEALAALGPLGSVKPVHFGFFEPPDQNCPFRARGCPASRPQWAGSFCVSKNPTLPRLSPAASWAYKRCTHVSHESGVYVSGSGGLEPSSASGGANRPPDPGALSTIFSTRWSLRADCTTTMSLPDSIAAHRAFPTWLRHRLYRI
jgi:hypothetical protein